MFYLFILFPLLLPLSLSKIRGVNLGGWLVLEPWIRPSLFSQFLTTSPNETAIDEFSFNKRLGPTEARRQLEKHWSEWVTEADFQRIHEYGLTHVRIPFGWWIFGDSEDYVHNISHLDRALDLAMKYEIKVLLDLHAAPGSQNGFDNSGIVCQSIQYGNHPATETQKDPMFDRDSNNMEVARKVLRKVAERYRTHPAVWGLEFVNEPYWGIDIDLLKEWYVGNYNELRSIVPHWQLVMQESFRPYSWVGFMQNTSEYSNIYLDSHIYLAFDPKNIALQDEDALLQKACDEAKQVEFMVQNEMKTFVGEWSLAINDCAEWLNGFRIGNRATDMGLDCGKAMSKDFYKKLAKNQLWVFEKSEGWMFWNFKNELENDWSWFKMVELGWVPNNAQDIPEFIKDSTCKEENGFLYFTN